jgi:cytochrome c biogenesis protein CcdA
LNSKEITLSISLLATLIGIGIVDSLNPSLFIAQFYLLTTPKPTNRVIAFIAGVWVVMVLGGILILGGVRTFVTENLSNLPETPVLIAQLVLGVVLLIFGWRYNAKPAETGEAKKPFSSTLLAAFVLGMVVMVNEITTALPYFIAIERIADANLSWSLNIVALVVYNVVFALPLFAFLGGFLLLKDRFTSQIESINAFIARWTPRIVKYGALILGVVCVVDGVGRLLS